MALRAKVLRIKAEKFEVKKLQVHTVVKEQLSALDPLLEDVYASRRPKPSDYKARRDLVHVFNEIAKEIYGNSKDVPVVVEFGSFVMDLFNITSDLDLSVNFSTNDVTFPREKKIQTLRKFAKKLYAIQSKGHVQGVLPITTAKVPILKCVDRGTGVECDISVENRDGILKSQIIHIITLIDERFQKLSFLMKTWAKAHNINSSKDKTLNSLSIILLVAFHLQTRKPPILPPFSALFKDGTDPATVLKSLPNFVNYGKRNTETLSELFVTLLIKLASVENLWAKGLCASTCDAIWNSKTWDSKVASISVEDFTDRSQNVARAVGQAEVKKIYKCINITIRNVFLFTDGHIAEARMRELLFGQDDIHTPIPRVARNAALPYGIPPRANQYGRGKKRKQAMPNDHVHIPTINPMQASVSRTWETIEQAGPSQLLSSNKKMQTTESWVGRPNGSWGGAHVEGWHSKPFETKTLQPLAGWAGTGTQPTGTGWEGTYQPSVGSWQGTHQTNNGSWGGWGGSQQPSTRGWGGSQQPNVGGWGGTQQPNGGGWDVPSRQHNCTTNNSWGTTW